ncbi:MAG TPA: presqualene diphosphate synthase HpnD [Methylomirabilota bacterium]|jgi:15-cis-phytoene synthase|nr:presqualene diphosphate synthase HpnD [Methylomirabilota bacterium]
MSLGSLSATLTRRSRSNFYYAFLTLPRRRRDALYAVYAFCRTVDDVADLGSDPAAQRAGLDAWRRDVARCFEPGPPPEHPIARQLAEAVRTYPIPRAALEAIIEGCAMDLDRVRFETAEDLYPYCYRVASAVGLCCIEIFGYTDPRARDYAVHLGTALQLTNILRDVGADAREGRVYLPQRDLREFGVSEADLVAGRHDERFVGLMEHQAARARRFYALAAEAYPVVDARSLIAAQIMGGIYRALLDEIVARRFAVFGDRITLSAGRKVAIALRCWAAARLRRERAA